MGQLHFNVEYTLNCRSENVRVKWTLRSRISNDCVTGSVDAEISCRYDQLDVYILTNKIILKHFTQETEETKRI